MRTDQVSNIYRTSPPPHIPYTTSTTYLNFVRSGERLYSFLSIGTGFLSDCDIESERLRCMGEARFALWALYRYGAGQDQDRQKFK